MAAAAAEGARLHHGEHGGAFVLGRAAGLRELHGAAGDGGYYTEHASRKGAKLPAV